MTGDCQQLDQLVDILLDNAVKYAAPGGAIRLTLNAAGRNAVLAVENPGERIPAEKLPHLFDRFYRADESHSGAVSGTGIGLSIVKATVEAHGGKTSAKQAGNTITFQVTL